MTYIFLFEVMKFSKFCLFGMMTTFYLLNFLEIVNKHTHTHTHTQNLINTCMFIYMMFGTDQDRYTFLIPWSGATCLPEDCCISELGRFKFNSARWPRTKRTSSSSSSLTCSRHDRAYKLLNWR